MELVGSRLRHHVRQATCVSSELCGVVARLYPELLDRVDRRIHSVSTMDPVFERQAIEKVVIVDITHSVDGDIPVADGNVLGSDLDRRESAGWTHGHSR